MHDDDRIDDDTEAARAARRTVNRRLVAMMAELGISIPDPEIADVARRRRLAELVGQKQADEWLAMARWQAGVVARRISLQDDPDP